MENEVYLKALLQKYVSGQVSREETELVLAWLKTPEGSHQLKNIMDTASKSAFHSAPEMNPGTSNEIYARLLKHIQASRASGKNPLIRRLTLPKKWRIAAALAGFLMLTAIGYRLVNNYNTITYTTDYAQKEVIILPDHSTVTLNGNSRLRFSRNWESKSIREVHLEGEAFFEVTRNEEKPFTVTTSEIGIKVLGTSFNVKSYADEETIETTLVSGKVEIRNLDKRSVDEEIVLQPSQKATYTKKSADIVLDEVRTELYTSWKSGMLIFEDEPFEEIARELERWYGVKISIKDEASRQCRFTIKIKDEPLTEVLDLFSSTTSASYSISSGKVTIEGNLCN